MSEINKVTPFTPEDARKANAERIPDRVVQAVNDLLAKQGGKNNITIYQEDVVNYLLGFYKREEIFEQNLLDFEDVYREQGWNVEYVKPAYFENFKAYWRFTEK